MYRVTIQTLTGNENTIFYPGNDDFTLINAVLELKVGSAGEFEFTIPINHPRYDEIIENSIVTVYEDASEIWRGDIREITQNFDKSLNVYCLEDISWLGDETVNMIAITNETYLQRFTNSLATYNANQTAKRQFTQGMLTSVTTTNTCNWKPEWEMTYLECLRRFIADDGYLKIRRVTSGGVVTRYLDILRLEDYGQMATQAIRFGENLLDFVKDIDTTNFLNVLYPYGAETETALYGDQMERLAGTPIQNDASIAAFGRRARTVVFETESEANLNRLALAYLNRYSQPKLKIEVKAIDLGNIEVVNRLHVGDSVRIVANKFGIDQWEYITKQSLDLLNLANNKIELSSSVQIRTSLTSQMAEQAQMIEEQQTASSILNEAKANALRILNGENGGVIYFVNNDDNQIIEQRIMNNADIDQATKAWRWNINGLGYLHRNYPSDAWQVGIAMTMDGQIVADYITTGTLNAEVMRANVITSINNNTTTTINGGKITTGSISADKMSVTQLSAISGNMGTLTAGTITGGNIKGTTEIVAQSAKITVEGGGYVRHRQSYYGDYQWMFDLGAQYCNCMYWDGVWRWVNGGATEIYRYLQGAYSPSDKRAKTKIIDLDPEFSRNLIMKTEPKMFEFTFNEGVKQFGMIAQDVEETLESLDFKDKNGLLTIPNKSDEWMSIEYKQYIPHLINMVKKQQAEIDELKKEIQILKEEKDG